MRCGVMLLLLTIYIYIAEDLGSNPSECHIFHLFRCVLSSLLPLRSVGRSNFDKGLHNLITLIKKRHKIIIEMKLLYYIYIHIYVCVYFTHMTKWSLRMYIVYYFTCKSQCKFFNGRKFEYIVVFSIKLANKF